MKVKIGLVLVDAFIRMPLWYFLMYSIIKAINPDRLVWFIFWIYLPASFISSVASIAFTSTGTENKK